jgi:hypothetical protein
MAYVGQEIPIPLGQHLLKTDDAQSQLPPSAAIKANNIDVYTGNIAKSSASTIYNVGKAVDAAIIALWDWFPTPSLQRLIAVTSNGKVWRDSGDATFSAQTAIKTGLGSPTSDTIICEGGAEAAGVNKKLFLFLGSSQVQVISGDATTTANILFPATDWASNFPTAGIVHNSRLWAFGNTNNRHTAYASRATNTETTQTFTITIAAPGVATANANGFANGQRVWLTTTGALPTGLSINTPYYIVAVAANTFELALTVGGAAITTSGAQSGVHTVHTGNMGHEDFHTAATGDSALTFPVYPGEGDGLIAACEYQSRLFFFKRPLGVYYLDDAANPADSTTWAIRKLSDAWGIASPHGALKILQDLVGANSTGSYTSLQATNAFGDVTAGDILALNQLENYIRGLFSKAGITSTQAIYYAEKKKAYFTARSAGASAQDRMLVIDVSKQTPRFSVETKDAPNCLALRKDTNSIQRPIYGGTDGYVYQMDQSGYNVNGVPYLGEVQTAYTDFSWVDASLGSKNKIFDFIEVWYVPRGSWSFYVDVYVDGTFRETVSILQKQSGAVLGSFVLDRDRLGDLPIARPYRTPLHCTGRSISLRIYNGSLDQDFRIDKLAIAFRLSAEQQQTS